MLKAKSTRYGDLACFDLRLHQIRYNNHDRSAMPHGSIEQSERFYDALRTWHRLLTDTQNEFWTKMQPGRPVIVDNWRVLHGRSGFTGYRRLCGAYINWDDYQSRLSMLTGAGHVKKFL
jgi:trimethyllysine dioxygenase